MQGESTAGRASMLANMRYHTNVIISLFSALGSLAASSRKLMKTGAYALRIRQLEEVAAEVAAGGSSVYIAVQCTLHAYIVLQWGILVSDGV